jgi:outer membrane protein OmpA-like peptidoglycan-associated protein
MNNDQLRNEWKQRLEDLSSSGLPMTQWAKEKGYKLHQVQYWKRKLNSSIPSKFLPINLNSEVNDSSSNESINIKIGKFELNVHFGFDSSTLKTVLSVLNELC